MDPRKLMMRLAQESSLEELLESLEGAISEHRQAIPYEKEDCFRKICMACSIVLAKRLLMEDPTGDGIISRMEKMDEMEKRIEDERKENPRNPFSGLTND